MNKLFLIGIVLLLSFPVYAQTAHLSNLDAQAFQFFKNNKYDEVVKILQESLAIAIKQYGVDSLEAAKYYGDLGGIYNVQDKESLAKEYLDKARTIREKHHVKGIPLGIQSEAFFEKVAQSKWQGAPPNSKQEASNQSLCDVNNDGVCDEKDRTICQKALGYCEGDPIYAEYAARCDMNSDGCIDNRDDEILFSEYGLIRHQVSPKTPQTPVQFEAK